MTSHLDADVIADYREGLLGERRSARIRAHLAGCTQCSSLEAGLAEVAELLASNPTPAMPEHLVTRLENALAVEVAARSGAAAARSDATPGRWHQRWHGQASAGRPRQWRTAVLGAAAVLVVILAVGGVYGLARTLHQNVSTSSSGAGGPAGPLATPNGNGNGSSHAGPMRPALLPTGSLHAVASGTDYRPGTLASQVKSVLASQNSASSAKLQPDARSTPVSGPQLQGCVTLVTGGVPPRVVDVAQYQGRPATIIVQAAASGQPAQVWVVGPGCSATSRDLIAHTEVTTGS